MFRKRMKSGKAPKNDIVKKFTLISVVGVSLALVYLWQHTQLLRIGYSLRNKEKRVSSLRKENQCLRLKICQLKSPSHIEKMIAQKDLNLTYTKNWQYVYVKNTAGFPRDVKAQASAKEVTAGKKEKKVSLAPIKKTVSYKL